MRLSLFFVAIAASFLFTSQAFSATMDNNQAKIATLASPADPNERLLRVHPRVEEEDDSEDDSEERNYWKYFSRTDKDDLIAHAKNLGFDLKASFKDTSIFNRLSSDHQWAYINKLNEIKKNTSLPRPP
ncbi:Avirulence (Avh) protein [Phytophthora megakarya]|uniref:RxLR effector protein n=1 Tax=Phytophthora megakarya TaxID=4795 RepID=A0A225W320_9STRA|nr:Avirulence (Avh) protein [Phytophthora megakarya]